MYTYISIYIICTKAQKLVNLDKRGQKKAVLFSEHSHLLILKLFS